MTHILIFTINIHVFRKKNCVKWGKNGLFAIGNGSDYWPLMEILAFIVALVLIIITNF